MLCNVFRYALIKMWNFHSLHFLRAACILNTKYRHIYRHQIKKRFTENSKFDGQFIQIVTFWRLSFSVLSPSSGLFTSGRLVQSQLGRAGGEIGQEGVVGECRLWGIPMDPLAQGNPPLSSLTPHPPSDFYNVVRMNF